MSSKQCRVKPNEHPPHPDTPNLSVSNQQRSFPRQFRRRMEYNKKDDERHFIPLENRRDRIQDQMKLLDFVLTSKAEEQRIKPENKTEKPEDTALEVIIMLNTAAMKIFSLDRGSSSRAESQLKQANHVVIKYISKSHPLYLWAKLITLSNLGFLYKSCGSLEKSIRTLQIANKLYNKAYESFSTLNRELGNNKNAINLELVGDPILVGIAVDICLNLSSVESRQGKHREAYVSAVHAIKLLERLAITSGESLPQEFHRLTAAKQLSIAQFNMAVELEHLGSYSCAWRAYELSAAVSKKCGNKEVHRLATEARDQILSNPHVVGYRHKNNKNSKFAVG